MPRNIDETACFDPTTGDSYPPNTDAQAHSGARSLGDVSAEPGEPFNVSGAKVSITRVSELAALAAPSRLRGYQVPREDLPNWRRRPRSARRQRRTHTRRPRTSCSSC